VHVYSVLLESVQELDDVSGGADVDKQQLRQLVVGEIALRQHPPTEDEEQQQQLLQQTNELLEQMNDLLQQTNKLLKQTNELLQQTNELLEQTNELIRVQLQRDVLPRTRRPTLTAATCHKFTTIVRQFEFYEF